MSRLLISFSGGETSALMAKLIMERMVDCYDEIRCVFANTGQENEETLEFVQRCDEVFGLNVRWIEAKIDPEMGQGTRFAEVEFQTADRSGRVFESLIAKYGIPNKTRAHCTRELKSRPIKYFARDVLGWPVGSYDLAIGVRIDEVDRMSPRANEQRIIYPLINAWPHRKIDVNEFWAAQPFRLELKGCEGNCKWCWKKSLRKHLTLITERPEIYEFPARMEREYGAAGAGYQGTPHVFFREGRSVDDLRRMAAKTRIAPAVDDARQYQIDLFPPFNNEFDAADGCSESCEVDFEIGEAA